MIAFGFSTQPRNPASALVRLLTGSKCSHAWLLLDGEDGFRGTAMVLEAVEGGVRLVPYLAFERKNTVVSVLEMPTGVSGQKGLDWAVQQLGKHYDYLGLLMNAWLQFGAWLRRSWKNPLQTRSALFCSELCVRMLQQEGVGWGLDPEGTSPEELRLFLLSCGCKSR